MENGNFKTVLLVEDEGLTRSAMKSLILKTPLDRKLSPVTGW